MDKQTDERLNEISEIINQGCLRLKQRSGKKSLSAYLEACKRQAALPKIKNQKEAA